MIREAAERTGDVVGDGTTTSTILAYAMIVEGVRNVAAGASAIDLKRGIDGGVRAAVKAIRDSVMLRICFRFWKPSFRATKPFSSWPKTSIRRP